MSDHNSIEKEENSSIYREMHNQSEAENREKVLGTRDAILKSESRVESKLDLWDAFAVAKFPYWAFETARLPKSWFQT